MRNQRGNMQLLIILLAVVGIVAGVYLVQQKTNFFPKAAAPSSNINRTVSTQAIQNDSDLTAASVDLDSIDLNSIDNSLNQNDSDASNF